MHYPIGTVLSGKELEKFLKCQVEDNINHLYSKLGEFDGESSFFAMMQFIRYMDELINIKLELGEIVAKDFLDIPIRDFPFDKNVTLAVNGFVSKFFGLEVAVRISKVIAMVCVVAKTYNDHGLTEMRDLNTIEDVISFLQSRRLNYVALFNMIPSKCQGTKKLETIDVLNEFQYYVDYCARPLTAAYHMLLLNKCIQSFEVIINERGMYGNYDYQQLDEFFLEPQRITPIQLRGLLTIQELQALSVKNSYALYSFEELDNMCNDDVIYYDRFGGKVITKRRELQSLVNDVKQYFKDGYYIVVTDDQYDRLKQRYSSFILCENVNNFFDALNSRMLFVHFNGKYYSNFFLLVRFYYNALSKVLNRNRQYQIKAGFLFEKQVTDVVKKYGFKNLNLKRVNHKEFDVVCVKDECIFNFQCKDNEIRANEINVENISRDSRYHKTKCSYYNSALKKEIGRESLLKKKVGLQKIKHYVITRFPVISDNDNIIPFNRFEERLKNSTI